MAKLTLNDLSSLTNEQGAIAAINVNSALTETAVEQTLSRFDIPPNQMETSLDMNSNPIYNLRAAGNDTEPVRKAEFDAAIGTITSGVVGDLDIVIANQAEAEEGTNNTKFMTPLRTTQAIEASPVIDAIETQLDEVLAGIGMPTLTYATLLLLQANVSEPVNTLALVYADGGGDAVNGLYQWNGSAWVRIADAPFANHEARLDVLEENTDELTTTERFGTVPVKELTDDSSWDFQMKSDLQYSSLYDIDFSVGAGSIQVAVGTSTGLTVGGSGGIPTGWNLTQTGGTNGVVALMSTIGVFPRYSHVFKFRCNSSTTTPQTVLLALSPTTPVPGGAQTVLPANAELITWRGDAGLIQSRNYLNSAPGTLTISNMVNNFTATWVADAGGQDELTWRIVSDDTGAEADCYLYVNDVFKQSFHVSGITNGWYLGPGAYFNSVVLDGCTFLQVMSVAKGMDYVDIEVFIDPSAPDGNTGKTIDSPLNIAGVYNFLNEDLGRRNITFTLFEGDENDYRGLYFLLNPAQRRTVTIRALPGHKPVLTGMQPILAGTGAWTRPDPGGNPNVWMTTAVGNNVSAMVQVGKSCTAGRANLTTIADTIYLTINYTDAAGVFHQASRATMNLAGNQGFLAMQLSGADVGKVYIHTVGNEDPNLYTWMTPIPDINAPIEIVQLDDTANAELKLIVDGIYMKYVYVGFAMSRIDVDLRNCTVEMAGAGSAFQFNATRGSVTNCRVKGTTADCFHASALSYVLLGSTTIGSPIVAVNSNYNANAFKVGSPMYTLLTTNVPSSARILTIDNPLQITLDTNATATATNAVFAVEGISNDTPTLVFNNCVGEGGITKTPTVPAGWNADGWSPHARSSNFILNNCEAKSCAGTGLAAGMQNCAAYNFKASDCTACWISAIPENGQSVNVEVMGGFSDGNDTGVRTFYNGTTITGPGTTTLARINVANAAFSDTVTALINSSHSLGAGADFMFINMDNCYYENGNTSTLASRTAINIPTYTAFHNP